MKLWQFVLIAALAAAVSGCVGEEPSDEDAESMTAPDMAEMKEPSCDPPPGLPSEVDFETQVRPILERSCAVGGCHDVTASGGFDLNDTLLKNGSVPVGRKGPIFRPCIPLESHIVGKVTNTCDVPFGSPMPLGKDPLSASDQATLYQWIAEGAQPTYDAAACEN